MKTIYLVFISLCLTVILQAQVSKTAHVSAGNLTLPSVSYIGVLMPYGSKQLYETASGWKNFNIILPARDRQKSNYYLQQLIFGKQKGSK